jgi:hypothetical protein
VRVLGQFPYAVAQPRVRADRRKRTACGALGAARLGGGSTRALGILMSRSGDLMRRALRRFWLPEMVRLGFVGKTSTFQRLGVDFQDLLSLQYWKYGGEFVLEFARRERGPFVTSWGPVIPEEKLDVAYISPLLRARLEQRGPASGEYLRGFDFSSFGEDTLKYEVLAKQVASLLPEVDEWLKNGRNGEHIHSFRGDA